MKIDERHLAQLAAVVEAGGVTEGAALLGLTQPAVSRTLSMLEKRLGEPLFLKGRRPLQPTQLGRSLALHGQQVLVAARRASEIADNFRHGRSGVVRIAGTPFFTDGLISTMIAEFHNDYPDIRVEQSYGYLPDLQAALKAGRVDLAICPVDVFDEESGFEFQEILPGRNVVACRTTHPLLLKRKLKASDLLDYPWIAPPPGSPLQADLRTILLSLGVTEIKTSYSGGSLASTINYMKATNALTVLPHGVVFALRNQHAVTALPLWIRHPARALGLLRLSGAPSVPAVSKFADHIRARFERLKDAIKRHEQAAIPSTKTK